MRDWIVRAVYVVGGAAIITVGVLVPVTAPYLIPLGAGVVGMSIPTIGLRK
jgi:hypothetical protein